jgi:hypothetical protein
MSTGGDDGSVTAASFSLLASNLAAYPAFPDPLPTPLSLTERQRAISHEGGLLRLRNLLAKLRAGANVTMAVLGGSVSAGSSSRVRPDQSGLFHRKLHRWLQRRFPAATISHINAAMPAVPPGYVRGRSGPTPRRAQSLWSTVRFDGALFSHTPADICTTRIWFLGVLR